MRPITLYILLGALFLCALGKSLFAFTVPSLTGPVVDHANIFSSKDEQTISHVLRTYYREHGIQMQVLVVPTLDGEPIEDVSLQVAETWKIGKADKGVLLLVAVQDRKLRIEVGAALEGDLPDVLAGRIIDRAIVPHFKKKQYGLGIYTGLATIADVLGKPLPEGVPIKSGRRRRGTGSVFGNLIFFLFLMFFMGGGRMFGRGGRRGRGGAWTWLLLGSMLGSGRSFGGGFGGGGGWSGGGGGFSGGGASGSW